MTLHRVASLPRSKHVRVHSAAVAQLRLCLQLRLHFSFIPPAQAAAVVRQCERGKTRRAVFRVTPLGWSVHRLLPARGPGRGVVHCCTAVFHACIHSFCARSGVTAQTLFIRSACACVCCHLVKHLCFFHHTHMSQKGRARVHAHAHAHAPRWHTSQQRRPMTLPGCFPHCACNYLCCLPPALSTMRSAVSSECTMEGRTWMVLDAPSA